MKMVCLYFQLTMRFGSIIKTSIPFKGIVANVLLLNLWKILKETRVYKYLTLQYACETTLADSAGGTGHPPPPHPDYAIDAFESRESRSETGPNWLITSNSWISHISIVLIKWDQDCHNMISKTYTARFKAHVTQNTLNRRG
jgi:hypothetical protein